MQKTGISGDFYFTTWPERNFWGFLLHNLAYWTTGPLVTILKDALYQTLGESIKSFLLSPKSHVMGHQRRPFFGAKLWGAIPAKIISDHY